MRKKTRNSRVHPSAVTVSAAGEKGRGVFATKRIHAGQIIAEAPALLYSVDEPENSLITEYAFRWDEEHDALALGLITLLNHSATPNSRVESDLDALLFRLYAIRDIAPGEEITFDYGCELWFKPAA